MSYTQHPLSAAFPPMAPEDFQSLKDSVENIGVQNPITLFEDMVIAVSYTHLTLPTKA